MMLLDPVNLPFAVALAVLFIIAILQLLGAGDVFDGGGDIDLDADLDVADGLEASGFFDGVASLLGIGKVPFLVWLASLLLIFAVIGLIGQAAASALLGSPFSATLAALLSAVVALPLNGIAIRPVAAMLPGDESSAVGLESLVRRDAVIQTGTARASSPARAQVKDVFGQPHFVMVEPHDPHAELAEGETVLLVRREGELFFAVRYESPLLTP